MHAVAGAFGIALDGRELALLCPRVENRFVGAPGGLHFPRLIPGRRRLPACRFG